MTAKPVPTTLTAATYGAKAIADKIGQLPNPFPRIMGPNVMKYLTEYIESGMGFTFMDRFERAFAEKLGVKHVIATPGCTPALHMLAASCGFEPGDEVIVSPISDYGTVAGLIHEDIIPIFADTEPDSPNLSAATIEPCITDRTRAIICVHKTGIICDMDPINALAAKHGLKVYEDACQASWAVTKAAWPARWPTRPPSVSIRKRPWAPIPAAAWSPMTTTWPPRRVSSARVAAPCRSPIKAHSTSYRPRHPPGQRPSPRTVAQLRSCPMKTSPSVTA